MFSNAWQNMTKIRAYGLLVLLACLAYIANYFAMPLFFGVDLIFGLSCLTVMSKPASKYFFSIFVR